LEGKIKLTLRSQKLSKASRLKKKKDFKFLKFKRFKTDLFIFVFNLEGRGRLGVSLSKKVLKSSVARNRVRRLLREVFRKNIEAFDGVDINVLGASALSQSWKELTYSDVEKRLQSLSQQLVKARRNE
jgi:ribonuclease P protein component